MKNETRERPPNRPAFADTDEEARVRYEQYVSKDPFPEIIPTLLNSADIADYVAEVGMVYPFNREDLKSASYGVRFLGKCMVWLGNGGGWQIINIGYGDTFTLGENSISFVSIEPTLRLPDYIGARFNLRITQIYRGLLLGTGPLIDPGFAGRISFPLHNLTTNSYAIRGGERIAWIEFTKISPNVRWAGGEKTERKRIGEYVEFPPEKKERIDVEDYVLLAEPNRPIRSSIPIAIQRAADDANRAARQVETTTRRIEIAALVSVVALTISLLALFFRVHSLVQSAIDQVDKAQIEMALSANEIPSLRATAEFQEAKIQALEAELNDLKENIGVDTGQIDNSTEDSSQDG